MPMSGFVDQALLGPDACTLGRALYQTRYVTGCAEDGTAQEEALYPSQGLCIQTEKGWGSHGN